MTQPIISCRNLNFSYAGSRVLKDMGLDFYPGEFVALLGRNGAGKSTLVNTICLAVANAVLAPLAVPDTRGDILEHLELSPGTRVGMVGHFGPLVPVIRKKGAKLTVFEIHSDPGSGIHGPEKIRDLMPECDVALITATSIINETFDDILKDAAACRHVAILGPSAPIAAACYEGTNVSCASGLIVRDKEKVLNAVAEAGGTRVFIPFTDKVNVNMADQPGK